MTAIRWSVLFLIFSLFSAPALADAPCNSLSWGDRDPVRAFVLNGNEAWIGGDSSLEMWRLSSSGAPSRIGRWSGGARAIAALGSGVATLDGSSLRVHDSSGVVAAVESGHTSLAVSGNRIVTGGTGLSLWQLEGSTLRLLDEMPLPGPAVKVAFDGSTAAAAMRSRGIAFARVSGDRLISSGSAGVTAHDLVLVGETIWVAAGATGLLPISATTLTPVPGAAVDSNQGEFVAITRSADRLVVADSHGSLRLYRAEGLQAQRLSVVPQRYDAVSASGGMVAARRMLRSRFGEPLPTRERLELFHLSDALTRASAIPGEGAALEGTAVRGDIVYVTDPPYLRVLRNTGRSLEEIGSVHYGDASDRIEISGDLAVVFGRGDAHLITISDPARPVYEGVFRGLGTSPNEIAFAGQWLLETNRGSGFHILDISDRTRPWQVGGMINDGAGQYHRVAGTPNTAYGVADQGVKVIDIRDISAVADPWTSRYERILPHGRTTALETVLSGPVGLLVVADDDTLHIYSLEDELDPTLRATLRTGEVRALGRIEAERAILVALADGGVLHVDLSTPSQPHIAATHEITATQVHADRDSIVAATSRSIVLIPRNATPLPRIITQALPDGRILVRWTGSLPWHLETSDSSLFEQTRQTFHSAAAAILGAEESGRFIRGVNACGSPSQSLRLPSAPSRLTINRSSIRLMGHPGETISTSFVVRNNGSTSEQLSIAAPDGIAVTPQEGTIAPGTSTTFTVSAVVPAVGRDTSLRVGEREIRVRVEPYSVTASGQTAAQSSLLIPGVGLTPGARGTMWRSRMDLLCASESPCELQLSWIGPGPERTLSLRLEAGEGVVIPDAGHALGVSGSGAVAVRGEEIHMVDAGATTFNDSASGNYGQRIEAVDLAASAHVRRWFVPALTADENFRTNLGIANIGAARNVVITYLGADGASLSNIHVLVDARSTVSLPVPPGSGAGAALVEADDIVVWASRVDQHTGDATYIRSIPRTAAGETLVPLDSILRIDQAGRTTGVAGSRWRTDVVLANPGSSAAKVEARWLPLDGSGQRVTLLTVAPGQTFTELADLLLVEPGLGSITLSSTSPIAAWARAWLEAEPAGTFGQLLPPGGDSGDLTASRRALFPLTESTEFRSNLFLAETAGRQASAVLEIRDTSGATLTAHTVELAPRQSVTWGSFLRSWGLDGAANVQLLVHPSPGSSIRAVASVVANATGDGVSLALEPGR